MENEGSVMIEFALAVIIFMMFVYGLIAISMWGIGSFFIQEAAHEAVEKYAVTLDRDKTRNRAIGRINRWAYPFIKPGSVDITIKPDPSDAAYTDTATVEISAMPRIPKLYIYSIPCIKRSSSCIFEYKFRNPGDYSNSP